MLPQNTSQVLQYMFPGVDPMLFGVSESPEKPLPGGGTRPRETTISGWHAPVTQPTEAEIVAAAATPEFAAWLDTHTDPIKQARAEAKQEVTSNAPRVIGERANILINYHAIVGTRQRNNAMLTALIAKGVFTAEEAAAFVQPIRHITEVIASRQALIDAGLAEVHAE